MQLLDINDTSLSIEAHGSGEPVILLHGGIVADAFAPLVAEPALAEHYHLVTYHRRGYGRSARVAGPVTIPQQADDCRMLMRRLGFERAHLVGYSFGGTIALQLALDAPESVQSLALLEPVIPAALADPAVGQFFMETIGSALERYAAGDKAGAIDVWSRGAFGPGYRDILDRALPKAYAQAVVDADTLFGPEMAMLQQWSFTADDARRIEQPVLSIYHADPRWPGFQATHDLLRSWLPQAEAHCLPNQTHLLQIANPGAIAKELADFLRRHPMNGRV